MTLIGKIIDLIVMKLGYIMKIKNCVLNEKAIKFTIFGNMMLMNVIVNVYQNVN